MTPTTETHQSLTRLKKAGYGSAELGVTAIEFFIQVYLLKFYTDVVGLQPSLAGLVLAAGMVWDAITDPFIGALSDGTTTKWGKRRPFMALGAPLLAAAFVMLFHPPGWESESLKALYLLGTYLLVNTSMTLLAVPHMALGGELTDHYQERSSLFGWRFLFANFGLLLAILLPALFAGNQTEADPVKATPWIAGFLILGTGITIFATRGMDRPGGNKGFSLRGFLKGTVTCMRNPTFIPLIAAFFVGSIGRTLNASIALFYYDIRLNIPEQDVFLYVLLPFTAIISISIIFWIYMAKHWGKKASAFWGILGLGIMTTIAYPLLPPSQILPPLAIGIVGGFLVGSIFLMDAAVTDVADFEKWKRGTANEGLYFGVWRLSSKLARALGLAGSGFVLDWIGFDAQAATQADGVAEKLGWIFGPGVGVCFIAAALILLAMPLNQRRLGILARALKRKQLNGQMNRRN